MRRLKALSGTVVVSPCDLERTERGHQLLPGSALTPGREITAPWALVVASGDPELALGERVILSVDLTAGEWQPDPDNPRGRMRVQRVCTTRVEREHARDAKVLAVERRFGAEDVVAVVMGESYRAPGTRLVLELVAEVPGELQGRVVSVGPRADTQLSVGDVALIDPVQAVRWRAHGRTWLSIRARHIAAQRLAA